MIAWLESVTHNAVSLSVSQVTLSSGCQDPQEVMASVQFAVWDNGRCFAPGVSTVY